jgi:hypothetical protein
MIVVEEKENMHQNEDLGKTLAILHLDVFYKEDGKFCCYSSFTRQSFR